MSLTKGLAVTVQKKRKGTSSAKSHLKLPTGGRGKQGQKRFPRQLKLYERKGLNS